MKIRSTRDILPLALALAAASVGAKAALAQPGAAGEPGYTRSKYPGVIVRSIPAPPQPRAATPKVRRNYRGERLINPRRSTHPRGRGVIIYDVDPDSLPYEVAHVTPSGEVVIQCNDPSHHHLAPDAHAATHGSQPKPRRHAAQTRAGAAKTTPLGAQPQKRGLVARTTKRTK